MSIERLLSLTAMLVLVAGVSHAQTTFTLPAPPPALPAPPEGQAGTHVFIGGPGSDTITTIAVVAGTFIATLIVVSVITVRISDMILDSRIGALDRTLGFLFGLARGLLIVVVAYEFFIWLVPEKQRPDWIQQAKSRAVLDASGEWLKGLLPDDPENTISKKFKKNKPEDESDADPAQPGTGDGYSKPARDGLKKLIEKPAAR